MKKIIIKAAFYLIVFYSTYSIYCISQNNISGDLGKLGGISFGKTYDKTLSENHLSNNLVKNIPFHDISNLVDKTHPAIFTFGDSFSQLQNAGYQNYLAHLWNGEIVNIQSNADSLLYHLISLLNSEIIDSSFCKIMIVESVDRDLIARLSNINFEYLYLPTVQEKPFNEITTELFKLCSWIRLQMNYDNPVKKYNLKKSPFTHKWANKLFYYKEDLNFFKIKKEDIDKAEENLLLLNKKFSAKGIKLIFLIAADKYDVYRPFASDNSLPTDHTTEKLPKIPCVCIIDSKPILQSMVQQGIKDVYRINDTHWSYKASETIAQAIYSIILDYS
jgi:hypothetical protein